MFTFRSSEAVSKVHEKKNFLVSVGKKFLFSLFPSRGKHVAISIADIWWRTRANFN